jgi:DNA-binding Lrp family transcriptional regulator
LRITGQQVQDAIIRALADEYSRRIILKTVEKAISVEELSHTLSIPISTCYRRVNEMREVGLLTVEKTIITDDGKKSELYRSAFRGINLQLHKGEIIVDVELNEDVAIRLSRLWASLRA